MPLYEFQCSACGDFEAWRPMHDAARTAACPACGAAATRRYSPPNLGRGSSPLRRAQERSERSAHEPEVASAESWARRRGAGAPLPGRADHRHG